MPLRDWESATVTVRYSSDDFLERLASRPWTAWRRPRSVECALEAPTCHAFSCTRRVDITRHHRCCGPSPAGARADQRTTRERRDDAALGQRHSGDQSDQLLERD